MEFKQLRNNSYSKGKDQMKKKLDTLEDPQTNNTIEDLGGSWATPLKNCLGAMF